MNVLTLEEARANLPQVTKAIFDELVRWIELNSWARLPKWKANNVLDSRWVLKWKMINDIRAVKARLTARGYKDAQAYDVNTYAGTASRWGQRLVNMICAQKKWTLFSADISQAFLRGLTFEEIKELDGEIKREVQITLPPGSIPVLRQIKGYEDFDPHTEVLGLLRGGFGLKDAPRLWQKKLQTILEKAGGRSLVTEPKLYVFNDPEGNLNMVLSSHVDDLKGGGEPSCCERVMKILEEAFGKMKMQYGTFECIGIMHEQDPKTKQIWTHQQHYVKQLKTINDAEYSVSHATDAVSVATYASFRSLLGAIAWLTQTMLPICVYVAFLQRQAENPTVGDVKKLNRLLRWIKSNLTQIGIRFHELVGPLRLVSVSDSAFKAQEYEGLAMRGAIIMLVSARTDLPVDSPWECVVLDWFSRKHTHVVRSTFAAELHSMLDSAGLAILLNATWTEIFSKQKLNPAMIAQMQDEGRLQLPMDLFIDAKSVRDAIAADQIKVPAEKTLYIHVLAGRDLLDRKLFERLIWIDTKDMIADGMTKGSIDRKALMEIGPTGLWQLKGDKPVAFTRSGRQTKRLQ